METFPGISPDFSSLAETPKSSPEKKRDDDDDDGAEKDDKKSNSEFKQKDPNKLKDDKSEKKDSSEKEVPLESLAGDEKLLVVKTLKEQANNELIDAPQDSLEEQEALMVATYYEVLEDNAGDGESVEHELDSSLETALDIAGIDFSGVMDERPSPDSVEPVSDTASEDDVDDDVVVVPPPPTGASTPPPTNSPPPRGAGLIPGPVSGGRGIPPLGPGGPGGYGSSLNAGGNIISLPTPDTDLDRAPDTHTDRRKVGNALLLGGIIGYMVGRRGGRIRTEKRLLPIQHKLEKEVTSLQQQIYLREEKIRSIVRNQVTQKPEMKQKIVERMQVLQELKHGVRSKRLENEAEQKTIPVLPEKLGMFAMGAERLTQEKIMVAEKPKDVERMNRRELVEVAEKITVEHSTLKKLFESGRLDEDGLRRVISAYLRGDHYDKIIRDNLKTAENFTVHETLQDNPSAVPAAYTSSSITSDSSQLPTTGTAASQVRQNSVFPNDTQNDDVINSPKGQKHTTQKGLAVAVVVAAVALVLFIALQ